MKTQITLFAFVAIAALAACGGGGGNSIPPTPSHTVAPAKATLKAGFIQSAGSAGTSNTGRQTMLRKRIEASSLGGDIVPTSIFWVADSYVVPVFGGEYQAVAYVNASPAPSPLPDIEFSQSGGPTLNFVGASQTLVDSATLPEGDSFIGAENMEAPPTVGQTTVTVASVALGQSVSLLADTYPLSALSTTGGLLVPGTSTVGLTFTTSGAQPTSSGAPDLSITPGSPTLINAPGGIVEEDTTIDQMNASSYTSGLPTSVSMSDACSQTIPVVGYIFKAASGVLVKMQVMGLYGPNVAPTPCDVTDFTLLYQVSNSSGVFAY
jgi:hypothetical protein